MGEDDIATEYPEHLNPFKEPKKRSAIGNSFRNLKRTLRQSFRLKNRDDKKVEVRRTDQSAGAAHLNHQGTETVALRKPNTVQRSNTLLLPRSRFNERVNHAKTLCPSTTDQLNSSNPFEEDAEEKPDETDKSPLNPFAEDEIAATDTLRKRYRRKKRAPLPPQLNRSEGNLLNVPDHHNSKWSLNSYDTDISNYASETDTEFNDNDFEPHKEDGSTDHLKDIQEMTAEIQKLCSNEIKEEDEEEVGGEAKRNIAMNDNAHSDSINNTDENVIVGDNADKDNEKPTDNESGEKVKTVCEEKIANDNNLDVAENHSNDEPATPNFNCEKQINEAVESTDIAQSDLEIINKDESAAVKNEAEIIIAIIEKVEDVAVQPEDIKVEVTEGDAKVVSEDAPVLMDDERKEETIVSDDQNNNTDELSGATDVHFYESKSMYIAGSNDNLLEFNQRKSIYVSGSRDELNNNLAIEEIDEDQPIPKIRKHKLTRGSLLGQKENA